VKYLILLLFTFNYLTPSSAQLLSYKTYNHKDGLNISTLNCVTQNKDGKIWVGTGGGDFILYDGTNFTEFPIAENSNFHINNVIFNENGFLFSTKYAGFHSYDANKKKSTLFDLRSFLFGEARLVLQDDYSTYFLGSLKFISKKGTNKPKEIFSSKHNIKIFTHFKAPIGIILFTNQGDFILKNGELMPLKKWFIQKNVPIDEYNFGYYSDNAIVLFHQSGDNVLTIKLNTNNQISSTIVSEIDNTALQGDSLLLFNYNKVKKQPAVISDKGDLFFLIENKWTKIPLNTKQKLNKPNCLFSDLNGDYWITTDFEGLIKIANDPFVKVESNQLFEAPNNFFLYQFSDGIRLISNSEGKTFIETQPKSNQFTSHSFSTYAITYIDSSYFIATSNGMRVYDLKDNPKLGMQFYKNQAISFVTSFDNKLFIALSGKGIQIYDLKKHTIKKPVIKNGYLPEHIYTGQISYDKKNIFFGTNNGIYKLSIETNSIEKIENELGYYSGISTKDIYGTIWFTIEKGIVGITKDNKTISIKGKEYFNSLLFYTMVADNFGNLFIGTNKGITRLRVNHKGQVLKKTIFNEDNNYFGYETNMRSQFKLKNMIYFGTIEGIFQINTELLENLPNPPPPSILIQSHSKEKTIDNSDIHAFFSVNNPKIKTISYQYRIDNGKWISLNNYSNEVFIEDLPNGVHTIESRSSYDNDSYGKSSVATFEIYTSFWSSSLFIVLLIGGVFILNFLILNYYKSFQTNKLIDSKDIDFHFSLTPVILLFAAITTPLTLIIAPLSDDNISLNLGAGLATTFILFILFSASLQLKKNNKTHFYGKLLKIGLIILTLDYFWELIHTNGHPYIIIGLILILSIVPYIYIKVKEVIFFSFVVLFISIILIFTVDIPVYPRSYFIYAISISSFLNVFYSYLRYDSLEKLIFISTIINKGNMPVIAFDRNGVINYASENISSFLDTDYSQLINQNIKILNNYIPFDSTFKKHDITKDFKDGEKYLAPMTDSNHEIKWIEWAFKNFSKDVNLILGQDVSDKMELENTYELLVQQAEDFIFKCDYNGEFKFINNFTYQRLGYTKEELINTKSIDLVSPKYKTEVSYFYRRHFAKKTLTSYKEFPVIQKNGEEIWIGQSITTLFSAGSKTQINGFIALARDITEKRKKNDLIKEQTESITASINYARRIQHNLLPSKKGFEENFNDFFIFSRAKDIVSGDFYWMDKVGDDIVLVLGDCTGHGVPGSFMTLLGFNLLNSTVLENRIVDPGQILNRIDQKLIEYLPRGEGKNTVNDAMELTVCVFNKKTNELSYACAGSRFLIYENEDFTMYKGDNKHAGDIEKNFLGYSTHFATFDNDINVYLFSDGFQDQFGGVKDKKFSFRRLIELFEANINLPLKEQQRLITETFDNWIGDSEQTDDVTILSVQIKKNKSI